MGLAGACEQNVKAQLLGRPKLSGIVAMGGERAGCLMDMVTRTFELRAYGSCHLPKQVAPVSLGFTWRASWFSRGMMSHCSHAERRRSQARFRMTPLIASGSLPPKCITSPGTAR